MGAGDWLRSGLVWAVVLAVVLALVAVGRWFSRHTLRIVTAVLVLSATITLAAWGEPAHHDFTDAFTQGASYASDAFFKPFYALVPDRIPGPDTTSLACFGVVLVVLYWLLEAWSARFEAPAVSFDDHDGPTDLITELQFRLPAVQVRRPSVVPGGATPETLAAVVESSSLPEKGLYAQLVRLAGALWPQPPRFVVKLRQEDRPGDAGQDGSGVQHLTVDVREARSQQSRMVRTVCCREGNAAERVAGLAARFVFATDPNTPRWSVGSFDGEDLAAYLLAQQVTADPRSPGEAARLRDHKAHLLDRAVRNSPGAGVARYELALLRDLQGDHLEALHLHAINCAQYPRFHRARYRLAMSLEMVAGLDLAGLWTGMPLADRRHLVRTLRRCGLPDAWHDRMLDEALTAVLPSPAQVRHLRWAFLRLSERQFRGYRRALGFWHLLTRRLLHRDQRDDLRPMLLPLRTAWASRHRIRLGARTAQDIAVVRRAILEGEWATVSRCLRRYRPAGQAGQAGARGWRQSWIACYDAACLHAAVVAALPAAPGPALTTAGVPGRAELVDRAVMLLEDVVDDPDCEMERPSDWMSVDPDLLPLTHETAFVSFRETQRAHDYPKSRSPS
ncbi:hypothetical protein [Actinoplanes sp. NPDC020271]|uniref:hypothetical protein n=1 Tax=Actinoplanes sp. NPDC020271 TaxID=3363896 RepID=UPI00379E5E88